MRLWRCERGCWFRRRQRIAVVVPAMPNSSSSIVRSGKTSVQGTNVGFALASGCAWMLGRRTSVRVSWRRETHCSPETWASRRGLRSARSHLIRLCALLAKGVCCGASLLAASGWQALALDQLTTARVLVAPSMARPPYLQAVTDPRFGTRLTRVTDPGRRLGEGIFCGVPFCRHRYSSAQAWNADQSLLVITKGCNGLCFLNGQTYEPAFHRRVDHDCKWHPTDPALMICVHARQVYTWAPRTDTKTTVYVASGYNTIQFGPYKGNPSRDGNRLVLRAINEAGALVAFAYDISERKKYPDIDLAEFPGTNDYCGISQSGRHIACISTKDRTDVAYIFTVDGRLVQRWTEHHRPGHGE